MRMPPWQEHSFDIVFPFLFSNDERRELYHAGFTLLETMIAEAGIIAATLALTQAIGPSHPDALQFIRETSGTIVIGTATSGSILTVIHGLMAIER